MGIDVEDHRSETVRAYMTVPGQTFVLEDSKRELAELPASSGDLIFLDGDHSLGYVKAEFLESLRILRPRGIICIHDYHSRGEKLGLTLRRLSSGRS